MMAGKDDKYEDEEENLTQVRSIIKQLNEDKPSQERRREVVVRADGTKVVRVTKKRKVMLSARDKERRGRRHFVLSLAGLFILLLAIAAFLFLRISSMSSSAYLSEKQLELQQSWGASSIVLEGQGIEGTSFCLSKVIAEFPESCMIERAELTGVSARLDLSSFLTNVFKADELKIERALLVLRNGAHMQMPVHQGKDLWTFRRMTCDNFTVQYADGENAPVMLKNAQAYMYYPHSSRGAGVLMLNSGELVMKGWKTVNIKEGKFHLSTSGIEDFSLRGTTDTASDIAEQRRTRIALAGRIGAGANMAGPYAVESDNMSLADFTRGRFEGFFTARTVAVSQGKISDSATITLAHETEEPVFNGEFHLKNICLSSFDALQAVTEHIDPAKRRLYNPLSVFRGYVMIDNQDGGISLSVPDDGIVERDLATLRGKMTLNADNELTGELHYGIPMLLARVEYPDGRPDPIFQQNGDWAVLSTRLKGFGNAPDDDMEEVEARAAIARRDRPERIPFNDLDLDKLREQLNSGETPAFMPQPSRQASPSSQNPQGNPFETAEDPFAPSTPF